jgi:hypothetical protein
MTIYLTLKISPLSILPDQIGGYRSQQSLVRGRVDMIGSPRPPKPKDMRHG